MSRGKMGVFAGVAAVALMFGSAPVSAAHHVIGAVDNIAPLVPANFTADVDLGGPEVTLTWELSESDVAGVTSVGNNADAGGANIVASNDVTGYIITRTATGEETVVYTVPAGVSEFIDGDDESEVLIASTYDYVLTVTDGTNEASTEAVTALLGDAPISSIDQPGPFAFGSIEVAADGSSEIVKSPVIISNAEGAGELVFSVSLSTAGFFTSSFFSEAEIDEPGISSESVNVGAGLTATVEVGFNALLVDNVNGEYTGTVTISTNDPANRKYVIEVSATVTGGADVARLDAVGDGLTFVDAPFGETRTQTLTVLNTGGLPLTADLDLTGDLVFDIAAEDESIDIAANSEVTVDVTFTPDVVDGEYTGLITITSAQDPAAAISIALVGAEGTVALDGEVEVVTQEIVATFSLDVDQATLDDPDLRFTYEITLCSAFVAALTADGFPIIESQCSVKSIVIGSTIVTFQILDPPADATDAPSAAEIATAVEDLVATEPATFEAAFTDEGLALGTVDAITSEAVTVTIQPIDAIGNAIAGWFTRTGTKVDFDDFFAFADAFGSSLGDPSFGSKFDISGADLTPDGTVNFDDFFRFADDFGKTVANAADIQALTLGG